MLFEYLIYLLALQSWMSPSEKPDEFLGPPSASMTDKLHSEAILAQAVSNPNVEYPRRGDFVVIQEISTISKWMKPHEAPYGYYACGVSIKHEGALLIGDDTSNNALWIYYCHIDNWKSRISAGLNHGEYGKWTKDYMCPENTFISGAAPVYEYFYLDQDNTGLNGIILYCKDLNGTSETDIWATPGKWGETQKKVEVQGKFVCGAQVSYDVAGYKGDRIGLDGVLFKFCNWKEEKQYSVIQGHWGQWLDFVKARSDFLACGFRVRFHYNNKENDESGVNGLKIIFCNIYDWSTQRESTVVEGKYGEWFGAEICNKGEFIDGLWVKNQDPQGPNKDDSAITGFWVKCSSPSDRSKTSERYSYLSTGTWGDLMSFGQNYLCGIQGRFDDSDIGQDTTGLNGLIMKSCEYNYKPTGYLVAADSTNGEWEPARAVSEEYLACGIQMITRQHFPDITLLYSMSMIYCSGRDWSKVEIPKLNEKQGGISYNDHKYTCPKDHYIRTLRFKQAKIKINGTEHTSINGIELFCYNSHKKNSVLKHDFKPAGALSEWVDIKAQYICGDQTLMERYTVQADASGLYGLKVKLCPGPWNYGGMFVDIFVGLWGDWTDAQRAEKDFFACGASTGFPSDESRDRVGVNGLKVIYCNKNDRSNQIVNTFSNDNSGWFSSTVMCSEGYFITGASVKNDGPNGEYDDEAVTGLKIICTDPKSNTSETLIVSDRVKSGKWVDPVTGPGFVCGAIVRIDPTPRGQDATGLNGISFEFCGMK